MITLLQHKEDPNDKQVRELMKKKKNEDLVHTEHEGYNAISKSKVNDIQFSTRFDIQKSH